MILTTAYRPGKPVTFANRPAPKTAGRALGRNWKWLVGIGCLIFLSLGIAGLLYQNTPSVRSDFWSNRGLTPFNSSLPQIRMPAFAIRNVSRPFFLKFTKEERAAVSKGLLPCEDGGLSSDSVHVELEEEQVGNPAKFIHKLKTSQDRGIRALKNEEGISGSRVIQDDAGNPIAVFKEGENMGDLVARQLSLSSEKHLHTPALLRVQFSEKEASIRCAKGTITEFIPHRSIAQGSLVALMLPSFATSTSASVQGVIALNLIMDHRDPHPGNSFTGPDQQHYAIDHEHTLQMAQQLDIPLLVRHVNRDDLMPNRMNRPGTFGPPFWTHPFRAPHTQGPVDPELAAWLGVFDAREALGDLDPRVVDFLDARLMVVRAAIEQNVFLPVQNNFYAYMIPRPDQAGETILDDYTAAIHMTARAHPQEQNDQVLRETFLGFFQQIAALRVRVFAGTLTLREFHDILNHALQRIEPALA